ncbi:MAG: adenosylhomocysteinase [Thermodesulfobacteriota bacteirum]|nr:adenosylhomocysteinase [Thermodesulfobacteriota bacterium]NSX00051.1 adenosylhomocysteinase [bacterium]|tara:strand:+ start:1470 stop:2723 length:1254 start_codon:yes stop_codon:yes gene_type:complete
MKSDVKDLKLNRMGRDRVEWAYQDMPVLQEINKDLSKRKPFKGINVAACLHVTTETANLLITLKNGGANVSACASNPLSTQDDVAAHLAKDYGISTYAIKGINNKGYYKHLVSSLDIKPNVTMDDGCDLVSILHKSHKKYLKDIIGGTEETTTGVIRLESMSKENVLNYPIIAVNNAFTKHLFDNRYGTGQSVLDSIMRATNRLLSGKTFAVCGYGWCGKGLAMRANGLGANVIVTEIDPTKALEAKMDGFQVMTGTEAFKRADFICSVTGNISVIDKHHFKIMKDGAIICNAGHFNVEINIDALRKMASKTKKIRNDIEEFTIGKKKVCLLSDGRLVNLSAAEGHPSSVMDMSFANQALCFEYLVKNHQKLENKVYDVPIKLDNKVAEIKLRSMNVKIDKLTAEQNTYLNSWESGT